MRKIHWLLQIWFNRQFWDMLQSLNSITCVILLGPSHMSSNDNKESFVILNYCQWFAYPHDWSYKNNCGCLTLIEWWALVEFFLNVFHWIHWFSDKKIYNIKRTRTCHPATSCVRDQHATSAPARHMWKIGSLIEPNSCFSDLSVSLNSLNSVKDLLHLGKTPLALIFVDKDYVLWN